MKKVYLGIIGISLLMFVCWTFIESIDLDNIKIDNISLGQDINTLDLSKYESKDEIDNEYNYEFKGLQIKTNSSNGVEKIWLNTLEHNFLSMDKKSNFKK